jgi:hypothetical protein
MTIMIKKRIAHLAPRTRAPVTCVRLIGPYRSFFKNFNYVHNHPLNKHSILHLIFFSSIFWKNSFPLDQLCCPWNNISLCSFALFVHPKKTSVCAMWREIDSELNIYSFFLSILLGLISTGGGGGGWQDSRLTGQTDLDGSSAVHAAAAAAAMQCRRPKPRLSSLAMD